MCWLQRTQLSLAQTLTHRNCEIVNVCCFEPLCLGTVVLLCNEMLIQWMWLIFLSTSKSLHQGEEREMQAIGIKRDADHFGNFKICLGCILFLYWFPYTQTLFYAFSKMKHRLYQVNILKRGIELMIYSEYENYSHLHPNFNLIQWHLKFWALEENHSFLTFKLFFHWIECNMLLVFFLFCGFIFI